MDVKSTAVAELKQVWRRSLPAGLFSPLISLIFGVLFQLAFSEIAHAIPSVYRQDAHVSLPVCNIFPKLTGCQPGVGALTGLEIWDLSQQVGQVSGIIVNLLVVGIISLWVSLKVSSYHSLTGLMTGMAAGLSSLALALVLHVPVDFHSARGMIGILALTMLPLSGYLGGRIGQDIRARRSFSRPVFFLPGRTADQTDWDGETLSQRELEVLALVAAGLKNREIARRLYISNATVKTHLIHIYAKLGVDSRTAAVTKALAFGLIRQEERGTESG